MKFTGLMKLIKSRSGILSVLIAILCGLLLGLIACHLYNLKKVEAFSQNEDVTYKFDVKFNDNDSKSMNKLDNLHEKKSDKMKGKKPVQPHANKKKSHELLDSLDSLLGDKESHESAGTKVQMDADSLNEYYKKLPRGIPSNQIPNGDEDLYILKSEIVPPVCPACPTFDCPREKKCPPCPACERCPEPAFECKKVPNYNVSNVDKFLPSSSNYFGMSKIDNKQPRPILNDFSEFN